MKRRVPAIRLNTVRKTYGDAIAVDGVSLSIEQGQFAVVLGPSGCGKTTLLRLVAGLERPDAGSIELHGRDATLLPPGRRDLGMVFQSYALFPHLNVAENLLFGVRLRHMPRDERRRRLAETSQLLGLDRLLRRKPAQLSGGQQQRVALGRAIIGGRRVVLMDEPLSNLDATLRHEMRQELRNLARDLGMTVLYVTHDQAEALGMGDVVIVMKAGRVEQAAAPQALYDRPASLFVAGFIGTPPMNLLPLTDGPDGPVIEGTRYRLPADRGRKLVLGLRPEQIAIAGPNDPQQGVEAETLSTEYLGADAVITCRVGVHRIAARVPARLRPQQGDRLRLTWPRDAENLFDAESGRRLPDPAPRAPHPAEKTEEKASWTAGIS